MNNYKNNPDEQLEPRDYLIIREAIPSKTHYFWDDLYTQACDVRPLLALESAFSHLVDLDETREAFEVFKAIYMLLGDFDFPIEAIEANPQYIEPFMREFIECSETEVYNIDRMYRNDFCAYLKKREYSK